MENSGLDENVGTLTEVAAALNAANGQCLSQSLQLPAMFFFTDEARLPDPLPAIAGLPEGCGVIFRHYETPARANLALEVIKACRDQGRICLVAGDGELAAQVGADGVHLPQHVAGQGARNLASDFRLVTAAAHDEQALVRAQEAGAHAAFLSPVFASQSHPDAPALGVEQFNKLVSTAPLPVYALGGITAKTAPQLLGSGAVGIGAIGALLS